MPGSDLSPAKRRASERKARRRAELIDAALKVFARDGFGGATIDSVAAEANTAKGTVYLYFKSKEELFREAIRSKVNPVLEQLGRSGPGRSGTPAARIAEKLDLVYGRLVRGEFKHILRMMIAEGRQFPILTELYYEAVICRLSDALCEPAPETGHASDFRDLPRGDMARVIMGPAMLASFWAVLFDRYDKLNIAAFKAAHLDLLLEGLIANGRMSPSDVPAQSATLAENISDGRRAAVIDKKSMRRGELIDAALAVFSELGFAATKIDDVVEAAKTSKGTMYLYFKSKEHLFEEAVRDRLLPVIEAAEQMRERVDGGPADLLDQQIRFLYSKIAGGDLRTILWLILSEGPRFPALTRFYYDNIIQRLLATISATLDEGIEAGVFRQVDSALVSRVIMGPSLLAGVWKLLFDRFETLDMGSMCEVHLVSVRNGLAARNGARGA